MPVQYVRWLGRALTGNFGRSVTSGREVGPEVARRVPWTLLLVATSLGTAWLLAVPLGLAMADGGARGWLAGAASGAGALVPAFLLCSLLVYVFAVRLAWAPILPPFELNLLDWHLWRSLMLPALGLALPTAAVLAQRIRDEMGTVLAMPYITAARAKGLPGRRVRRQAARVVTSALLAQPLPILAAAFSGVVVVEEILGWPGMGRALMRAVAQRDIITIQGLLFSLAVLAVAAELVIRVAAGRGASGPVMGSNPRRRPGRASPLPPPGPALWIPMLVVGAVVAAAVAAPLLVRFPPDQVLLGEIHQAPSWRHWMGTDASGRDLYSRLLFAGRTTLGLTLASAAAAVAAAAGLGALAHWRAGKGDRLTHVVLRSVSAVPALALVLAVVVVTGRSPVALGAVFVVVGLTQVAGRVQILMGEASRWPFVEAGRAAGAPPRWIAERHLLPHLARPLVTEILGLVPGLVVLEATLGFFGYSLSPTTPTWGTLLWRGREVLYRGDWWLLVFPVAFVMASGWGFGRLAAALSHPAPPAYRSVRRLAPGWERQAGVATPRAVAPARRAVIRPAPSAAESAPSPGGGDGGD